MERRRKNVMGRMSVTKLSDIEDRSFRLHYETCYEAEGLLSASVRNRAFVIVNDSFLVKMDGNTLAVALRDDPNQGIQTGYWYILNDTPGRKALREAFIRGESHVTLTETSNWLRSRMIDDKRFSTFSGRETSLVIAEAIEGFSDSIMLQDEEARRTYVDRRHQEFNTQSWRS